jgi:hypothetical protein
VHINYSSNLCLVNIYQRSTDSFTEEEAFALCNSSIYNTPAVMEFPDYLAEEDPDIIVEQCVYDLTVS